MVTNDRSFKLGDGPFDFEVYQEGGCNFLNRLLKTSFRFLFIKIINLFVGYY